MVSALGMAHAVVGSESLDRTMGGGGSEVDMAGASADRNLRRDGRQAQDAGGSQAETLWGWAGPGYLTQAGQSPCGKSRQTLGSAFADLFSLSLATILMFVLLDLQMTGGRLSLHS